MDEHERIGFLEIAQTGQRIEPLMPLRADRWIAASVLQKSIRRNDPATAINAAYTLWRDDKKSFWRRVQTVSVEDVGIASPDALTQTLTAFNTTAQRTKSDDLQTGLSLVRLLCGSVKTHLAHDLYTIADKAPDLHRLKNAMREETDQTLADYVLNPDHSLPERAVCLWLLAGTKRHPSDTMPERVGSMEYAAEVLQSLQAPDDLKSACIDAMKKTPSVLILFTPLVWATVQQDPSPTRVIRDPFPASPLVKGIPLVALDHHTRIGKACFSQLRKIVGNLQPFSLHAIATATFHNEGRCIDQRLTSDAMDDLRQAAECSDIESMGLDTPDYLGLKDAMIEHADLLDTIRRKELQNYWNTPQQGEFPFGRQSLWT